MNYDEGQIVKFLLPISRRERIGRVTAMRGHTHIKFVGGFGKHKFLMGVKVDPDDVFPDVSEEDRKQYTIDLLKAGL